MTAANKDKTEDEQSAAARKAPVDDRAPAEGPKSKVKVEKHLDHSLEETFPASDPVSISPGAD